MSRFLLSVLVFGLAATVGCDRQQPATSAAAKGNTGGLTPSMKPPSGDSVTTPGQPGGNVPPVVQQPSAPIQPVVQGPKIELGDSEQRPVLFFELRTGMVIRVSDLKYDNSGWVESYVASVQTDKGEQAKVLVRTDTPAGGGKAPTHAATVNEKPVSRKSDKKLVGLSVKDTGGVVLDRPSGINVQTKFSYDPTGRKEGTQQEYQHEGKTIAMTTKFSYDPTGRQEVGQQNVQHEGKTFTITYSDYRRENSGRLAGYAAQVVKAE